MRILILIFATFWHTTSKEIKTVDIGINVSISGTGWIQNIIKNQNPCQSRIIFYCNWPARLKIYYLNWYISKSWLEDVQNPNLFWYQYNDMYEPLDTQNPEIELDLTFLRSRLGYEEKQVRIQTLTGDLILFKGQ